MSLAKPLEPLESLSRCLDPWAIRWPIIFSRNLSRIFTHYLSEQPEMSSHDEASKKAKTVKGLNKMKTIISTILAVKQVFHDLRVYIRWMRSGIKL
jgi:hypothetical protein